MCKQTQINANIYYHTTFSIFLTFLSDFCKNPIGIPDSYRILIILGGGTVKYCRFGAILLAESQFPVSDVSGELLFLNTGLTKLVHSRLIP